MEKGGSVNGGVCWLSLDDQKKTPQCVCLFGPSEYIPTVRHIPVIPGICFRSRHSHIFPFGNSQFPFPRMLISSLPFFGSTTLCTAIFSKIYKIKKKKDKNQEQAKYNIYQREHTLPWRWALFPFPCYFDTRALSFVQKKKWRVPMLPQVSITFWPDERPFMSA